MNNNIRTLRGRMTQGQRRVVVDDGRPNHGYRVLDFRVFPTGVTDAGLSGALATQYDSLGFCDGGDNRQIAWAFCSWNTSGTASNANEFAVIDPDHVIITDLYVQALAPGETMNYLIIVEPITMTDDEAILRLVKERSQDDIR